MAMQNGGSARGYQEFVLPLADPTAAVRLSFPWFATRSQQATAVRAAVVSRRLGDIPCIRFDDVLGNLADVHVHPLYGTEQIIGELRRCGYQVLDNRAKEVPRWCLRRR
jgi:hypothetical protein